MTAHQVSLTALNKLVAMAMRHAEGNPEVMVLKRDVKDYIELCRILLIEAYALVEVRHTRTLPVSAEECNSFKQRVRDALR